MCLGAIKPSLRQEIAKLKPEKGYITLWKVFGLNNRNELIAPYMRVGYFEGKNTCTDNRLGNGIVSYDSGFHCFVTEKDAKHYSLKREHVQSVKVRKSWITTIGTTGYEKRTLDVVVCKHIII